MEMKSDLLADFKKAKMVNMITYAEDGSKRIRVMTNFNEDPYNIMWFATYSSTRKVRDIEKDPRVIISFAGSNEGKFWEIEGIASFEKSDVVSKKWVWWYLYWHPEAEKNGWGLKGSSSLVDHRRIINVKPYSTRLVEVDFPKY
jgi:general stress protein 26